MSSRNIFTLCAHHSSFISNKKVTVEVNFYDEKIRLTAAEQSIAKKDPI